LETCAVDQMDDAGMMPDDAHEPYLPLAIAPKAGTFSTESFWRL
jgi:hypothetical protein